MTNKTVEEPTTALCSCGNRYSLYRFFPFDQTICPDCRAKERRANRLRGSDVPIFLRRQAD